MEPLSSIDFSYYAGVLDHSSSLVSYKDGSLCLQISSRSEDILEFFKCNFGGSIEPLKTRILLNFYDRKIIVEIIQKFSGYLQIKNLKYGQLNINQKVANDFNIYHYIAGAIESQGCFNLTKQGHFGFRYPLMTKEERVIFRDLNINISDRYASSFEKKSIKILKYFSIYLRGPKTIDSLKIYINNFQNNLQIKNINYQTQRNTFNQIREKQILNNIFKNGIKKETDKTILFYEWYDKMWEMCAIGQKTCGVCNNQKNLSEFYIAKDGKDGYSNSCKKCIASRGLIWKGANKEKHKEINKRARKKIRKKPIYRIKHHLGERLRKLTNLKSDKIFSLIGCSPNDLRLHLESLFKPDMSWDTYGKWHIDHIIPCRAFDLNNPEHQRKYFHFSNLRPLWSWENSSKSDILPDGRKARDVYPRQ